MNKSKRNHWVPQVYLKLFAADQPKRAKIWTFGKTGGDPELKPIKRVAVKFYLYTPIASSGQRDYRFEQKLSEIERIMGYSFWKEIANGYVDFNHQSIRKGIALMMAVMLLRNPKQFRKFQAQHQNMVRMLKSFDSLPDQVEVGGKVYDLDTKDWEKYSSLDENNQKELWINIIKDARSYALDLMKMRWSVLCVDTPLYITTDNPVAILHPDLSFKGIRNPMTTIMFPLSPTRVLYLDNKLDEPANQYYPDPTPQVTNFLLWKEADDKMFSSRIIDEVLYEIVSDAEQKGYHFSD